jgi:hypothetical protein
MKRKTQNPVFIALAVILVSFLFTCKPFASGGYDESDSGETTYTNVEYSPDGSVTIYLDGSMPVRSSRALTLKWAQIGHDFFEVAFFDPASNRVARASWETGHAAGVNGVVRNLDYASAIPTGLGAGQGAAILFVGKKSDKTLLAVGRLTNTNDPLNVGPTYVSANTRSVTFSVAALVAGTNESNINSSFVTTAGGGTGNAIRRSSTQILPVLIGKYLFPLYRFRSPPGVGTPAPTTQNADYYIRVVPGDSITNYREGILQAGPATFAELPPGENRLEPRYPNGAVTGIPYDYPTWSLYNGKDTDTLVAFRPGTNAPDGESPLPLPPSGTGTDNEPAALTVSFQFTNISSANNGKIFAFSFQVPVYPLTNVDGRRAKGDWWYIRPGYDSYLYDLDDGKGGTGGAILIGTGEFKDVSYFLSVKPPVKAVYSIDNTFVFNLEGIIVTLMAGSETSNFVLETLLSNPTSNLEVPSNLRFWIGSSPRTQITIGQNLRDLLLPGPPPGTGTPDPNYVSTTGTFDVTVEYTDPNLQIEGGGAAVVYTTKFTLFLFTGTGTPGSGAIPQANRYVFAEHNEIQNFINSVNTNPGGNYLLVFFDSYDLSSLTLSGGQYYFVIIAAAEGVVIGKSAANAFTVQGTAANSTFYLGVWPFNETLSVQGLAITSYPLTINAGGSYQNLTTPSGRFINNGPTPLIPVDVIEGPGLDIRNPGYFRYP